MLEASDLPLKVWPNRLRWMSKHEQTVIRISQRALQSHQPCPPCRNDQRCMQELPVQLLHILERVLQTCSPFFDGQPILCCLFRGQGDRASFEVPHEAKVRCFAGERHILRTLPWYPQLLQDPINIHHAVHKTTIIASARASSREILEGERAVLKHLKHIPIRQNTTTIPDSTT